MLIDPQNANHADWILFRWDGAEWFVCFLVFKMTETIPKSLNTIYFTPMTPKAHRTCRRVLEGADVGILWSYVVQETEAPRGNHRP